MNQAQWSAVDEYLSGLLIGPDAALEEALQTSAAAGLPAINVAPNQGKLLQILARVVGARRILEVGTLGGYSTIWLARGWRMMERIARDRRVTATAVQTVGVKGWDGMVVAVVVM